VVYVCASVVAIYLLSCNDASVVLFLRLRLLLEKEQPCSVVISHPLFVFCAPLLG